VLLDGSVGGAVTEGPRTDAHPYDSYRPFWSGNRTAISRIELETEGQVPGIDAVTFEQVAQEAKVECPVSKALAAVEVSLEAKLQK